MVDRERRYQNIRITIQRILQCAQVAFCILNLDEKDCNENNITCQENILLQNDRAARRAFNNKIVLKQGLFI